MKRVIWIANPTGAIAHLSACADDWACDVELLLAHPRGSTRLNEYVPPFKKYLWELTKGLVPPTAASHAAPAMMGSC